MDSLVDLVWALTGDRILTLAYLDYALNNWATGQGSFIYFWITEFGQYFQDILCLVLGAVSKNSEEF